MMMNICVLFVRKKRLIAQKFCRACTASRASTSDAKNIVGNAIRRMRETDYFCSSDCSATYQRIISMQNNNRTLMSSFAAEMKATISASVAKEMHQVSTEIKQITATIEKSQEFLSDKFDEIVTDFKDLKLENELLKEKVERLEKSQSQLQGMVHKLEANVDKSDKASLGNNAVVWGIPTTQDENVSLIIGKLFSCLGLSSISEHVASAERIFVNSKISNALVPIRIVFCDRVSKELVLNKKKQLGKLLSTMIDSKFVVNGRAMDVTLRDELTPLALELLKDLREYQEVLNIKYVWPGRGGVILAKRDDNSKPELIKNREDLNRVKSHFMKIAHVSDSLIATGHSPSPKRKKNVQ